MVNIVYLLRYTHLLLVEGKKLTFNEFILEIENYFENLYTQIIDVAEEVSKIKYAILFRPLTCLIAFLHRNKKTIKKIINLIVYIAGHINNILMVFLRIRITLWIFIAKQLKKHLPEDIDTLNYWLEAYMRQFVRRAYVYNKVAELCVFLFECRVRFYYACLHYCHVFLYWRIQFYYFLLKWNNIFLEKRLRFYSSFLTQYAILLRYRLMLLQTLIIWIFNTLRWLWGILRTLFRVAVSTETALFIYRWWITTLEYRFYRTWKEMNEAATIPMGTYLIYLVIRVPFQLVAEYRVQILECLKTIFQSLVWFIKLQKELTDYNIMRFAAWGLITIIIAAAPTLAILKDIQLIYIEQITALFMILNLIISVRMNLCFTTTRHLFIHLILCTVWLSFLKCEQYMPLLFLAEVGTVFFIITLLRNQNFNKHGTSLNIIIALAVCLFVCYQTNNVYFTNQLSKYLTYFDTHDFKALSNLINTQMIKYTLPVFIVFFTLTTVYIFLNNKTSGTKTPQTAADVKAFNSFKDFNAKTKGSTTSKFF